MRWRDKRFPGVSKFKDQHGKWRWRARGKGKRATMIHGEYGSAQFVAEWQAWCKGEPIEIGVARTVPGTINALMVGYYKSGVFADLSVTTRKSYRAMLERVRAKNGDKAINTLNPATIRALRNRMNPEPANMLLRCLRSLCRYAVDEGFFKQDPTLGLRKRKNPNESKDGIHTWTIEEVEQFEKRHPLGTKAHLAHSLLIYTAQRRSDIVGLGRQHEADAGTTLKFRQQKTGEWMELPIVRPLRAAIDAAPVGSLTYLETALGKPFSAAGFGNWFRERCDEAGLPQCSAHGLRKATATRLADAGATTHQIMAITGHRSIAQVESYTRKANKKRLAQQMSAALAGSKERLDDGKYEHGDSVIALPSRKAKQSE